MNAFNTLIGLAKRIYHRWIRFMNGNSYQLGRYSIFYPPNHGLPVYQKQYRLYDRFLPVLVKHLDSNKLIIDVGANIGDSAIAMAQNCSNPILCFEPSDKFTYFLRKNIEHIGELVKERVEIRKVMVGTGKISGELLHHESGTAGLIMKSTSDNLTHKPLDDCVAIQNQVILIKTDTDGFDFDVIQSASMILKNSEPVLFWENEISNEFQLDSFNKLYFFLDNLGYDKLTIFDNFGNILIEDGSYSVLCDLNNYLISMTKFNCSRTFHYIDVLAHTGKYSKQVALALKDYKDNWIFRT